MISYVWGYEYYYDYVEPTPVDERKLKANKSISFRINLLYTGFEFSFILLGDPYGVHRAESSCLWRIHLNIHLLISTVRFSMKIATISICIFVMILKQ
uniref:Uncharacterized protein n=1 Tax=Erpetoichthys calabaricus TaxID=27687 RepID=A0A8C4SWX1_ERPCA